MTLCEYRYCREPIAPGRREGTRFCDSRCRVKEWRLRQRSRPTGPVTRRTDTGAPRTPSSGGTSRRSSRDGRGLHVYLPPEEIEDLTKFWPFPTGPVRNRIEDAKERLEERSP